jgi:hypothetical protein
MYYTMFQLHESYEVELASSSLLQIKHELTHNLQQFFNFETTKKISKKKGRGGGGGGVCIMFFPKDSSSLTIGRKKDLIRIITMFEFSTCCVNSCNLCMCSSLQAADKPNLASPAPAGYHHSGRGKAVRTVCISHLL